MCGSVLNCHLQKLIPREYSADLEFRTGAQVWPLFQCKRIRLFHHMVYYIQSLQSRLLGKEACNALSSFGAGLQGFHLGIVLILDDGLHGLL